MSKRKKWIEDIINQKQANKALYEHYKELLEASISELRFEKLSVSHLLSVLNEVETMTTDKLAKKVIENGIERHNLDKLIHARGVFE